MSNADIVPFGKYQGQSVDTLLADDDYVRWVMAQPGLVQMLRRRHPALFNIITIGSPQSEDTPDHNRLQARFLNRAFQEAIIEAVTGKRVCDRATRQAADDNAEAQATLSLEIKEAAERVDRATKYLKSWKAQPMTFPEWLETIRLATPEEKQRYCDDFPRIMEQHRREGERLVRDLEHAYSHLLDRTSYAHQPFPVIAPDIYVSFEHGFDVKLELWLKKSWYRLSDGYRQALIWPPIAEQGQTRFVRTLLQVEIKPQMGDDFPAVLRQIRHNDANVVLVGQFRAEGASLDEVKQMFGECTIIMVSEVDAIIARDQGVNCGYSGNLSAS